MPRISRDVIPGGVAPRPSRDLLRPLELGASWDLAVVRHAARHDFMGTGVTAVPLADPRSAENAYRFSEDPGLAAACADAYTAGRTETCRCPGAARDIARSGIVLLRNSDGLLPLRPGCRVTVSEPGRPAALADALAARHGDIEVTTPSRADAVIVVVDPRSPGPPPPVATGPRAIVVLVGGNPPLAERSPAHAPAVLWSAGTGSGLGPALADVLLGRTAEGLPVEATGRLPQTWHRSPGELPDPGDPGGDITYQRFRGTPLHAFGHGLGYTRFAHRRVRLADDLLRPGGTAALSVDVLNIGGRRGTEVLQVYSRHRGPHPGPLRRLRRFARVHLDPGAERTVTFRLGHEEFADGRHTLTVARSCLAVTGSAQIALSGR